MFRFPLTLLLLVVFDHFRCFQCVSMLFLVMPQSPSHRRSMYPLARALGQKGHDIRFFSEMGLDDGVKCNHPKVLDDHVVVQVPDKDFYDYNIHRNSTFFSDFQWLGSNDGPLHLDHFWKSTSGFCHLLTRQKPEELERVAAGHYDVIVIDSIFSVCGMGLLKRLHKPYILFNPTTLTISDAVLRNAPLPPAYVAPVVTRFGHEHQAFADRLYSVGSYIADYFLRFRWDRFINGALNRRVADEPISLADFYENAAISFVDLPAAFDFVRPQQPDTINIAGKCELFDPKINDEQLLRFVEHPGSKGTIVLSFGHGVQWRLVSREIIDAFFGAFANLTDYRILFQYEGLVPTELPNVRTAGWFPLVGLLHHPKTKLHVTHGGAKSITETVCAQVPMIVLPLYADQNRNANVIKSIGAGLSLNKFRLTRGTILETFRDVLNNDTYRRKVSKLKQFTIDTVRPPQELAVFWTEFVLRHPKSLKFINHRGLHMSFFVHFCLDVLLVSAAALLVVVAVAILSGRLVLRKFREYWSKKQRGKTS